LLQLYRYRELNPVRAGIDSNPGEYCWTSYQINALGKKSNLCTAHQEYPAQGREVMKPQFNYRSQFDHQDESELLEEIRKKPIEGWRLDMTASKKR